jgi:hypothetical protein
MLRSCLTLVRQLSSSLIVAVVIGITTPLVAAAQQVGDTIELNAERTDGGPLHRNPRVGAQAADFQRVLMRR